ncbi:hypothetical protein AAFF_G00357200 [Aldrovandia affinis]|uniref:Uncharacterized protein n=1 Tax=Aldrovandia affinis TaxID=143900 RepID=A0AAD7T8V0_9TELE|nr:hypothetical protein AAFF_G00357200 [Aldrovandia affinis]
MLLQNAPAWNLGVGPPYNRVRNDSSHAGGGGQSLESSRREDYPGVSAPPSALRLNAGRQEASAGGEQR